MRPQFRGSERGLPSGVPKSVAIFWPQILANRGEARQLGLTPLYRNWWPENGRKKMTIFRPPPENSKQEREKKKIFTVRLRTKIITNRLRTQINTIRLRTKNNTIRLRTKNQDHQTEDKKLDKQNDSDPSFHMTTAAVRCKECLFCVRRHSPSSHMTWSLAAMLRCVACPTTRKHCSKNKHASVAKPRCTSNAKTTYNFCRGFDSPTEPKKKKLCDAARAST